MIRNNRLITSILSSREGALGDEAEDALGSLVVGPGGEAYGLGGLGLSGTGIGGGHGIGDGAGHLVKIGDIGPGRRPGGWSTGTARLRPRRPQRLPPIGVGIPTIRGALDRSIVRRYIRQNIQQFKYCYTRSLQQNAKLQGRVVVKFIIAGTGQVTLSKVQRSTMGHASTEQCLAQAMRRITFPKPQGGGIVVVSYPFVFRSAGQ
ncbi:MAG: TonB family protein [Deltaproteobacteria bacterium]|nr:TonB family protein [Deltaproteobacteria bacterium]